MASIIETAAASVVGPKLVRNFRFSWLVYGAAAYLGLRYMNKRGMFPQQTGAALDLVDKGIGMAKEHFGIKSEPTAKNETH
ncbi:MAG: hypothetical protein EOP04_17610 [Proteobacteria bacterium]|nr:MAG: hypothetical protein EOP04_17610 [Pseudomonadota bacterium]